MNTGSLGAWNLRQVPYSCCPFMWAVVHDRMAYAAAFASGPSAVVAWQSRGHQGRCLWLQLAFNKPVKIPSWAVVSFTDPRYTENDLQVRSKHCMQCLCISSIASKVHFISGTSSCECS